MDSVMKGLMGAMPPPQNFWAKTAPVGAGLSSAERSSCRPTDNCVKAIKGRIGNNMKLYTKYVQAYHRIEKGDRSMVEDAGLFVDFLITARKT